MSDDRFIAPPPRTLPLGVRLQVGLGGVVQQMGWADFTTGRVEEVIIVAMTWWGLR